MNSSARFDVGAGRMRGTLTSGGESITHFFLTIHKAAGTRRPIQDTGVLRVKVEFQVDEEVLSQ